ncbi:LysR family transcriptional regulator [Nocardioides sp.]|uniref:LysR family transcriptional regulator n=1 Tax=Nocardioides sp. TaxID=35761 RepID=UPI0035131DF6
MMLRQLEYLVALAQEGHFGRAAQACHVTQPALSAGIRKLESELGVRVVRRGQRFEGFTPEGAEVLTWAQRMLAERTSLTQTLDSMRDGLSGTLRIGAIPTALSMSALLTGRVRQEHPLVRFRIESSTSREIVRRVNDYEIDAGLTYIDGEPLGTVRTVPLYRERYLLLSPAPEGAAEADAAPGVDDEPATWEEAAASPLCLLTPDMQNRRILEGHLTEAGGPVDVIVEADTISAIYAHVVAMGLSSVVAHTWVATLGIPAGMRVRRLPDPKRGVHVGIVLAGQGPEPLLARALVDAVRDLDLDGLLKPAVDPLGAPLG